MVKMRGALRRVRRSRQERPWEQRDAFVARSYSSYDEYISHQAAKLETLDLADYDARYRELLAQRLSTAAHVEPDARVLCLAARIGTEVRAFHDLGCFAVGIDVNPGEGNRWVLHGDFHDLQFPDGSVDVVFTNSLDHALDVDRLLQEVRRVLRPGGLFVLEASLGADEGFKPREFETFYWATVEDLLLLVEGHGFTRLGSLGFEQPWPGIHATLRLDGR